MKKQKLLIIEDDESIKNQMKWALFEDYEIFLAQDGSSALEIIKKEDPNLVTLDLGLPPDPMHMEEGLIVLKKILQHNPLVKIIVVTGNPEKSAALQAIAQGAYDFYTKPIDIDELKITLKRASYVHDLEKEYRRLQEQLPEDIFAGIIGTSRPMQEVFAAVRKVATTDIPVLVTGESGTGKELVAKAIHNLSDRKNEPFIAINCGAIPEGLLESELFGHEKGSFTGAYFQKKGKFEMARNGTIFLDEIGDLALPLQVKILRFLQEHKIERIGGNKEISLKVRVVAATNRDLLEAISQGVFREDLYYRLCVIHIAIPPLKKRGEDLILIATTFMRRFSSEYGKNIRGFTEEAFETMKNYNWPGNVRELENKIKRAIIMAEGELIGSGDMQLSSSKDWIDGSLALTAAREKLEKEYITRALHKNRGGMSGAARELGISRQHLYDMVNKYGINKES